MYNCENKKINVNLEIQSGSNVKPNPLNSIGQNIYMKKQFLSFYLILSLLLIGNAFQSQAQITVAGTQTANTLAQTLVGAGVTISNPTMNCPPNANGTFVVTPPNTTNLGLQSGIVLTSGTAQTTALVQGANGPASGPSTSNGTGGDADLTALVNGATFDGCVLEFDFVPLGDTVKFDYVFGSTEYPGFTCSNFNDVFGFFISGPGITGPFSLSSQNIALVPGSTTCPVGVSTIYCPNLPGCCNTANTNCFNLTPGCGAFNAVNNTCAYFVCNAAGTSVNYQGFTVPLQAVAVVQPCSTYHLKLAIADKGDGILDSGVFLREGSLSSNSIVFTPQSVLNNPNPYIVEGCAAGFVKVKRPVASPFPYTVNYQLGGSATYPADYSVATIPAGAPFGQITIPAGDTVAYLAISAILDGLPEGTEEIKIYQLAPCSNNIIDSSSLFISDTFQMHIITPDTSICKEDFVNILVSGDDSLVYTWTPTTFITNPNIKEPTVNPPVTTDYIVCANLPNSGCADKCDTIKITIYQPPNVFIGNDTIICQDMSIFYNATITPNQQYTYAWSGSGAGFLTSLTTDTTTGNFTQVGNFNLILNVEPQAQGCAGADTVNIEVIPHDITLHNNDTVICKGGQVPINVTGHPYFTYNWTPSTYLNDPLLEDPLSIPDSSITYTVTAFFPGCSLMVKSFNIEVQPIPSIYAGDDREMCKWDTVQLHATVNPSWYTQYSYSWASNANLNNGTIKNPVFDGPITENIELIVSTPLGCSDTDNVVITVYPTDFAVVNPQDTTICPGDRVDYIAAGGISYHWTPGLYLNDTLIYNPFSVPNIPVEYTVYSTSVHGCTDTDIVRINVASAAVLDAGEDVILYPGETYTMSPGGNCSFFTWFPDYHLSDKSIKNPIANPPVSTQYFVSGITEFGCKINDSITIRISEETLLDLPNAFSPGSGTSINDELKIIKRGLATLNYYKIFNRWGQLVFQTTDINKGWDGRFNGTVQPIGVYVYVIDAQTSTGKRFYKQGNVTLIR